MNVSKTISQLKKFGWILKRHLKFNNKEHNYIFANANNTEQMVLWCVGKLVCDTSRLDFGFMED